MEENNKTILEKIPLEGWAKRADVPAKSQKQKGQAGEKPRKIKWKQ